MESIGEGTPGEARVFLPWEGPLALLIVAICVVVAYFIARWVDRERN